MPASPPDRSLHAALGPLERAVYQALAYASLSDYPMGIPEIHRGLPRYRTYPAAVGAALADAEPLRRHVSRVGEWFCLAGQEASADRRRERERFSDEFLGRHRGLLDGLGALPWVRGVAVSGSLAFRNARPSMEDLDVFLITGSGRLWLAVSAVWAYRRARGGPLCVNYLVSEDAPRLPYQGLYNAHQLAHLRPVAGHGAFAALWAANPWVLAFFPNFDPVSAARGEEPWAASPSARRVRGSGSRTVDSLPPWLVSLARAAEERADNLVYDAYRERLRRRGRDANTQAETYDRTTFKRHPNDHRVPLMDRLGGLLRAAGWPESEIP